MLARLVSLCLLLSLSIYTCYPVTQINSVNKYAASKVSLLYSMVFFCLSVTHSLVNSFANAFFKYNVPRRRQAEIAFPTLCDHFLRRLGFRNMLGGDVCLCDWEQKTSAACSVHVHVGQKINQTGSVKKKTRRARSCACGCTASERLALEEKPLAGCVRGALACAPPVGLGME